MRSLIALMLLPSCELMITDEEYLARITPQMTGTLTVPEGVYVPEGAAQIGLLEVDLSEGWLYVDDPELLVSTSLGALSAGGSADYSMQLPVDFEGVEFGEMDPDEPGMLGQVWGLGAWAWSPDHTEDTPGFSPQDRYLAASSVKLLAWIVEPQGRYLNELEAQPGYNFLTYDYDSGRVLSVQPVLTTGMSWNLGADLAMQRQDNLRVTVSLSGAPARNPRVDIYRISEFGLTQESPFPEPTLLTEALTSSSGTEFLDLDYAFEEPRWDHLAEEGPAVDVGDWGTLVTIYAGIAYSDSNEDGQWAGLDGTELPLGSSVSLSSGDDSYFVACLRPITFRAALAAEEGLGMGWQVIKVRDDTAEVADWATGIAVD